MTGKYDIRYSDVLWELFKAHLLSTSTVGYLVGLIVLMVFFSNSPDSLPPPGVPAFLFLFLMPLFIIPYSFGFAIPSFIIMTIVSYTMIKRRCLSMYVWVFSALLIGQVYYIFLLPYSLYVFLYFSIPISILNGVLMCRVARRYYSKNDVAVASTKVL